MLRVAGMLLLAAGLPALALGLGVGKPGKPSRPEPSARPYAVAHVTQGEARSLFGIFAMHHQMKMFKSAADHVVFISEDTPQTYASLLEAVGIKTIRYDSHEISDPLKVCEDCWSATFQKITALKQSQYKSVVVVDYDVHALENFDEVFSFESPAMASWCGKRGSEYLDDQVSCAPNSGVFVAKPNKQLYNKMISAFSELRPGGALKNLMPGERRYSDQSFLKEFLYKGYYPGINVTQLPRMFNARSAAIEEFGKEARELKHNLKLVHFTLHKPYQDGWRIEKDLKKPSMLADILCETTRAAQATLDENPGLAGKFREYDIYLGSWKGLSGDWHFGKWVHHHCTGLP